MKAFDVSGYQTELYKNKKNVRKVTFQDRLAAILILCSSFCHSSAYLPPDEVQYELPLLDGCRSAAKNPLQNPREMLQIWRKVG